MPLPRKLLLFCFLPYYTDMILLVFVGFLSSLFLLKVMCLLLTLYPTSSFTCTPPLLGSNETNVFQSSTQTAWFSSLPWYQSHFKLHVSQSSTPSMCLPTFSFCQLRTSVFQDSDLEFIQTPLPLPPCIVMFNWQTTLHLPWIKSDLNCFFSNYTTHSMPSSLQVTGEF
jgi:hypothetical protein